MAKEKKMNQLQGP